MTSPSDSSESSRKSEHDGDQTADQVHLLAQFAPSP
jgi:hypothetical protein